MMAPQSRADNYWTLEIKWTNNWFQLSSYYFACMCLVTCFCSVVTASCVRPLNRQTDGRTVDGSNSRRRLTYHCSMERSKAARLLADKTRLAARQDLVPLVGQTSRHRPLTRHGPGGGDGHLFQHQPARPATFMTFDDVVSRRWVNDHIITLQPSLGSWQSV